MKIISTLNPQSLWLDISGSMKNHIPETSFKAWLQGVQPLKVDEDGKVLILGVPNELTRRWIQKHYQQIITSELIKINPNIKHIKLTISRRATRKNSQNPQSAKKNIPLEISVVDRNTNLNPDLSFENFILSSYNRFAYTAAQASMEKCGVLYNPIYFYGPTGVGKTHLLQAIGNQMKKRNPSLNAFYISSEQFIEEYINSIKKDQVSTFRDKYKNYQLLAIDDAQFFKKSESVLIELFHLFNHLVNQNSQIILSSDQPPSEIEGIEDRIKTRLNSGIVIDIKNPTNEDIKIVCTELSERMGLNLTPDAIEYITENTSHNIREVSGALKNIHLNTLEENGRIVDIHDVKKYIKNRIKTISNISYDDVISAVCGHYEIKKDLLSTKLRKREVVLARQMAMYIFREHMGMSYSFIGKHFGNRDHTTVIHACEKINTYLQNNSKTQKDFDIIKKKINF